MPAALATGALLLALGSPALRDPTPSPRPTAASFYRKLPLAFEPNAGRTDPRVRFLARGPGYALFLTPRETVLELDRAVVRTRLLGARPAARIDGEARLPGIVNSYVGRHAHTGISTYRRVRYREVYPGTDVVYYGRQGRLEYDFVLKPGADARRLGFAVAGVHSLALDAAGNLVMHTRGGVVKQLRPYAYQRVGAAIRHVQAAFVVAGRTVHISVGAYDQSRTLVVDPRLLYSTYFGGNGSEYGWGMAADGSGDVYLTGATLSTDFPTTGTNLPYHSGSFGDRDAFLTHFSADGQTRVFSTYFGGNGEDVAKAIALDGAGGVYITGYSASTNLYNSDATQHPTSAATTAFYAKFDTDGNLKYSGELGGTTLLTSYNSWATGPFTEGEAITADSSGNAYVTGGTDVSDLKADYTTLSGKTDVTPNNSVTGDTVSDAFVLKIAPNIGPNDNETNPTLSYLHLLGGNSLDEGYGITNDGAGAAIVVGRSYSSTFEGAGAAGGLYDGFVAKMKTDGTAVAASRYIGGANSEQTRAIARDGSGNLYVAGIAQSGLPTTSGAFQESFPGNGGTSQGYVMKLNSSLTTVWSTYLGGTGAGSGTVLNAIAVDSQGNAYVAGTTDSNGIPMVNAVQGSYRALGDALIAKLKADGSALVYSTYLGGSNGPEEGDALAIGPNGSLIMSGWSFGNDFPVTADAAQPHLNGCCDAIIVKLAPKPAQVDSGPSGPTNDATPTFAFSAEGGDSFKCGVDGGAPSSDCTPPKDLPTQSQGPHTFKVQAFDSGGTSDGTVATRSFTVDTVAPATPALQSPGDGATGVSFTPTFAWSPASDPAPATGVGHYELIVDGAKNRDVPASACSGNTCSAQPVAALAEGSHTWKVRAVDAAGNTGSDSAQRSFTSSAPPTAVLVMAPNPALVGKQVTFDGSQSSAGGGTIAKFEWDLDGNGSFETDTGTTATTTHSYSAAGTVNIALRVTTVSGQTATDTKPLTISTQTGLTQFGVSINNGAQYTRAPDVTVTCVFPASTTALLFSNDGGFFAPTQFTAQRETKWRLDSSGPERLPKIVYVRFLTGPITSETHTDDIILDETPPKVEQAAVTPAAPTAARTAAAAKLRAWNVKVKATDSNSGVGKLQVTANKRKPGRLIPYKRRLKVKSAKRPKWVRARDKAGNFSAWRRAK